jgi:sigma-B regulation protein RsbU (phosphoserine phosphatase)
LCADEPAAVQDLRRALEEAGQAVGWHRLGTAEPDDLARYDVILIEDSRGAAAARHFCQRLGLHLGDRYIPTVFITADTTAAGRLAAFEAGADTCLVRPFGPGELLAQVRALGRVKGLHDRLSDKTAEVQRMNRQLQLFHQRVTQEMELARRIQQSFLPQSLPVVPRARFGVHFRPCGRVGGDFYDIFRLDEHHVGFYVADAMGHGVPASLLTMFLKKGVRGKEITGNDYRLVAPNEVLGRLNHELIEQQLADNPFITMVYALFNFQQGTLHFARAGHPHPLYLPTDGPPELWRVPGSLLGVFETKFTVQTCQLKPGDKVLFYTDGAETAAAFEGHPAGTSSLTACAARYRALPIAELVARLAEELFRQVELLDDFTVLGVEVGE